MVFTEMGFLLVNEALDKKRGEGNYDDNILKLILHVMSVRPLTIH